MIFKHIKDHVKQPLDWNKRVFKGLDYAIQLNTNKKIIY